MSQVEVERFLGRIITDAGFRANVVNSQYKACFEIGFTLSMEELSFLRNIDFALVESIAATIDDSIKRT